MEGTTAWLVGVLAVSFMGNIAQLLIKRTDAPSHETVMGIIEGRIAVHSVSCPNMTAVQAELKSINDKLDRHINFHLDRGKE